MEQTFKTIRIDFRKEFSADFSLNKAWMDDNFSQQRNIVSYTWKQEKMSLQNQVNIWITN